MRGSYRAEILKLRKWPAMWVLATVFLVLAQVFGYLIPYVGYRAGGGSGFAAGETPTQLLADLLPARLVANTLGGSRCSPARSR
jgi:ABC-2 type transport system permease protein